jgi:hypothetical protein
MYKNVRLLYIGSLDRWSNSSRRYKALSILCSVQALNTDPYLLPRYISGFQHHLNAGPGIFLLNRKIRKVVKEQPFDIIWVDNKPYLNPRTLELIKKRHPAARIINLLTDDPFGKYTNSWSLFKRTISLYDAFFVQRRVNQHELQMRGAKKAALCYRSFDPEFERPLVLTEEERKRYGASVGFVGTYEDVRASFIAYLIKNGIPVLVTGNDWPGGDYWDVIEPYYNGPSVFNEEYIKALNGPDIVLHFLRHANRDEQDSRTFEIPACQRFMLAERSQVHTQLFREDEEAVFFSTKEELLEKVKHYLANPVERERIALNGYKRCFNSGYTHRERMETVLKCILEDSK